MNPQNSNYYSNIFNNEQDLKTFLCGFVLPARSIFIGDKI